MSGTPGIPVVNGREDVKNQNDDELLEAARGLLEVRDFYPADDPLYRLDGVIRWIRSLVDRHPSPTAMVDEAPLPETVTIEATMTIERAVNFASKPSPSCLAEEIVVDACREALQGTPEPVWPEWLTPEHSALHTAIENAIKSGTQSVYNSSDGASLPWTEEGMVSCQASSVLSALKRYGWTPPDPVPACAPTPLPECPDLGDDDEADGYWCTEGEGVIGGERVKLEHPVVDVTHSAQPGEKTT